MRWAAAVATIVLCVAASVATGAREHAAPHFSAPASGVHAKQNGEKPSYEANSCRWALDNECDEPDIGTGACAAGTDESDCRILRTGVDDDSCRWARDGECDEPQFGTGACAQGSDRTDCGDIAWMRNNRDSCATAFNAVCDEPGREGNGLCAPRTDRTDCNTRARPPLINDHFGGHDDRVIMSADEAPGRYTGRLQMESGVGCGATLIGRDIILTAANCLFTDNQLRPRAEFFASTRGLSANIVAYWYSSRYDPVEFSRTDSVDGRDWALMRLDRPLGDEVGFAPVRDLIGEGRDQALTVDLFQAGYAWDTGTNLVGHRGCRIVRTFRDNTFAHNCDTTLGNGGSAIFAQGPNGFEVIGVDSNFRRNPGHGPINIAVGVAAFERHIADFAAGRTGAEIR